MSTTTTTTTAATSGPRPAVLAEIARMLLRDTDEFHRWASNRYRFGSAIGERLTDYAGGVRVLAEWVAQEAER